MAAHGVKVGVVGRVDSAVTHYGIDTAGVDQALVAAEPSGGQRA